MSNETPDDNNPYHISLPEMMNLMTKRDSVLQHLTRESITMRLDGWERNLLTPGGATSYSWLSITMSWVPGTKRGGNVLKRGKAYGRIVYSDHNGQEIPKAVAIEEAMKPSGLRQAEHDIEKMLVCSICNAVAIGYDQQEHWHKHWLAWAKYPDKDKEVWIVFCPKCQLQIAAGTITRKRG